MYFDAIGGSVLVSQAMKTLSNLSVIFLLLLTVVACSKNATTELEAPKASFHQALHNGSFSLVPDASEVKVKMVKDDVVPVNAVFNFSSGVLKSEASGVSFAAVVDLASFNSALPQRDGNVTKIFFGVEDITKKSLDFAVIKLPADAVKSLHTSEAATGVVVDGEINFRGKLIAIKPKLNVTKKGERLVVDTAEPFVVKITDLGLGEALQALSAVCGHKNVADEVTISVHVELAP